MKSPLRAGMTDDCDDDLFDEEEEDVFDIPPKAAPIEMLKKWRKATLALNASRRFRYTLDLERHEAEKGASNRELLSRFRTVTHTLLAVNRFKKAGARLRVDVPPPDGFGISAGRLAELVRDGDTQSLEKQGGVVGIARALHTDVGKGIDPEPDSVNGRKQAYGSNYIPRKKGKSFWVFAWEACHDTTLIILMGCAAVSLATGMWTDGPKEGWYDGTSIALAVILVILVTAISDYKQSLQFRSLTDEKQNIQIDVTRGERRIKVSIFDIVVGDVATINIGDQIPADGIFISGQSLSIDESSMTGESMPVSKDAHHPFLMSGCKVSDGYGKMLVTAVGINTEWGQVMATLSEDNGEETPLQVRLNGAATFIGQIGLSVAVLVFLILFVRYFAKDYKNSKPKPSKVIKKVVDIFSIAVTIIVVAVPEGLPLAVTLTLAYSMRKMMRDKSLVRHLAACETMGSATTICSDKTGTLTLNQMSVVKAWVGGDIRAPEEVKQLPTEIYSTLLAGICQNSSGSVYVPTGGGEAEVSGSPTEVAALSWGVKIGMDYTDIKSKTSIVHVETFNSTKKRAGVAIKLKSGDIEAHWKGAAEIILEQSSQWVDADGSIKVLTEDKANELKKDIEGMAAASLRCIAFAYKPLSSEDVPESEEELKRWKISDDDLVFLAIIGIKDPCRPGVQVAVAKCQAAGVKVRMVTGDSVLTAAAIAQECGIRTPDGIVVEGKVFRCYTKEEMTENLPKIDVLARSSPTDKLLLVKSLKERGEVVAVTGDGTNDAPALHEADVGLSMGISGTEVAKESSDVVILDDDFASVVKVIRWGRVVYSNIQNFIQFQLTVNVAALVINFVSAVADGEVPLTPVQLLWVNLIMDTLGALALATEPPTDELMLRTPVGRREPLITNIMWRNIFFQAAYQVAVLLTLNFGGENILKISGDSDRRQLVLNTIIFNAFVFCQLFNEVNARKPVKLNIFSGLFTNQLFIGVVIVSVIFQIIMVEFLKKFASTTSLGWQQWLICIIIGFISWPLAFFVKFIPVPKKPMINTRMFRMRRRKQLKGSSRSKAGSEGDILSAHSKGQSNLLGKKTPGDDGSFTSANATATLEGGDMDRDHQVANNV